MFPEAIKTNTITQHLNDVLCGRGGGSQHHAGNKEFRAVISLNRRRYISASPQHKKLLVDSIVTAVRLQNPSGRFLERDPSTGLWNDIGDKRAIVKTSQALREGAPKIRQAMVNETKQQVIRAKKYVRIPPESIAVRMVTASEKVVNNKGLDMLMAADSERLREEMVTAARCESQFNEVVGGTVATFGSFEITPKPTYQAPKASYCGSNYSGDPYDAPPAYQVAHVNATSVPYNSNFNFSNNRVRNCDAPPVPSTTATSSFKDNEIADLNIVTPFSSMVFHKKAHGVASGTLQLLLNEDENVSINNHHAIDTLTGGVILSQNELEQNIEALCDFSDFLDGVDLETAQSNSY